LGSSIATIPVSLISAEKINVPSEIREFAVPFLAAIHMLGDMAMQVFGAMAIYYIFMGEMISLSLMVSYVFLLSALLIVVPGTPGGAAVTTKPFLISFLGFPVPLSETFFAIAVTNDSFATGTNIMADCAIIMLLEKIHKKLKRNKS
jgi:Na+/H+-dicarboxylate symporter